MDNEFELYKGYPSSSVVVVLNPRMNKLLTEASKRSKRAKTQEAAVRLQDHLMNFSDIATTGKRFKKEE